MTLLDRALVRLLPAVPKPVVRALASRYIAGAELGDALRVVRALNEQGKLATIDVLGEDVTNPEEAEAITRAYLEVLDAIERERLDANLSVKPTALGLELGYEHLRANLETVVRAAAGHGNFVRIDMEDSSTTDATLRVYRELREAGLDNVGIVLQAALRRTLADARALAPLRPNVRLCKGIYVEPEAIAYHDREQVRTSFLETLETLLEAGCYVGVATHDDVLIARAETLVAARGLGRDAYEFQMLLGVRPELGDALVAKGHRLRVYVPFGTHWYRYSLRRLQENPKVAGYVASDVLRRLVPRRR